MALIRKQSKVSDKIPTSSMADIAFLLLIFFLVTTVFDEEKGLQVVLPELSDDVEVEISPKNLLFFLVQPNGSVVVRRGESQQTQMITHRQVEGVMRQALTSNPRIIAAVQTHPQARYEDMTNVLDGIQTAGATRFSLQLLEQ
ncbi:biopolymer transporter ExbD [soil metagenome]|jgi:biopolymer transport protein ExbD|nr:biopolymer transporter ExbD [Gemmatimonadota bacterium]